jgi:TPR repeat protein
MSELTSQPMQQALFEYEQENYTNALELLIPLAESGDPTAQCYLAAMYQFGLGVEIDCTEAIELYIKAAKQGIMDGYLSGLAYHNLETIYRVGAPGIPQDEERANQYALLAKEFGFDM